MLALAPGRDHSALASAIADTVEKEGCFVTGANCERRTAALMVSVAFRESTFRLEAVGDQGRSVCSFQILGGSRDLLTDATACALEGHRRLKASLQACRGSIAMYAAGRCDSARGKALTRTGSAWRSAFWRAMKRSWTSYADAERNDEGRLAACMLAGWRPGEFESLG